MRVVLDQPFRRGEQLLVDVASEFHGSFNVTAQIMWTEHTPEDCYIAGCEFCTILSLKQRAQLQRLSEMALGDVPDACEVAVATAICPRLDFYPGEGGMMSADRSVSRRAWMSSVAATSLIGVAAAQDKGAAKPNREELEKASPNG